MKRALFTKKMDKLFADCRELNHRKGKDYAGDSDALRNFKVRARESGVSPIQVWSIYAGKHWDAVQSYVRNGQVESEPIEERIKDLITYLALLNGLIDEETNSKKRQKKSLERV